MTDRRVIFLPSIPLDIHIETLKKNNGKNLKEFHSNYPKNLSKIVKISKFGLERIFLLIEKFADPTLKAHSLVLKRDMNPNDIPN